MNESARTHIGGSEHGPGPIVVVGGHAQGLFLRVEAVPREGESVLGSGYEEPADGGKASNQAVAAARLGAPVLLVTVVGSDERGKRALRLFEEQGIDTRFVEEVDGPTDVGFVMLPPSAIPAIATAMDRNRELDAAVVARASGAIAGASLVVCQLEAPQESALAAFRLARAAGARTLLNPAPASELKPELLGLSDLFVPNEHEAAILAGRDGPPAELAALLARELPVETVVVTAGAAGAYVTERGSEVLHLPAQVVSPVDTTGAGDAFVGGLAVKLRAGDALRDAVAFAVRAASLSVTRPGTMLAFPTAAEMEALAP
jgi:ribokinase